MPTSPSEGTFFLPAATVDEAVARIFSLTGATPAGTRGEKRAIVALRDALTLDIEVTRTNTYMGQRVAAALGIEWHPSFADRNKLTLAGLNALLEGATQAYNRDALARIAGNRPESLAGSEWQAFEPAQSKIEAVNRISALTDSGPEWLGPGSKEHKRVLQNLAIRLAPRIDLKLSKTKLAAALAKEFHAPWTDECESTGETISLSGLNTLLAGAERQLGKLGTSRAMLLGTPEQEGKALAAALLDAWPTVPQRDGGKRVLWNARECIQWMVSQGVTDGPNHNEWQGFYWEARGRTVLNAAFKPNPNPPQTKYGKTSFDYSLRYVWDLKAHTEFWRYPSTGETRRGQAAAPLNDQEAMRLCIQDQGLGFLMVGGVAIADEDGSFVRWHRAFKANQGIKSRHSHSGVSRQRKAAFEPLHVEAFYFHNSAALEAAKAAGQITGFRQGMQAPQSLGGSGRARRPKYILNVPKSRETAIQVARFEWPRRDATNDDALSMQAQKGLRHRRRDPQDAPSEKAPNQPKPADSTGASMEWRRGFAVVHGLHEAGKQPIEVWSVAYSGGRATNVNAVVISPSDPAREQKLDALLWQQLVLDAVGGALPSVQDASRRFILEAARHQGTSTDALSPSLYRGADPASTRQHIAFVAANELVTAWNYWLATTRRSPLLGDQALPVIPVSVLQLAGSGPIRLVGIPPT